MMVHLHMPIFDHSKTPSIPFFARDFRIRPRFNLIHVVVKSLFMQRCTCFAPKPLLPEEYAWWLLSDLHCSPTEFFSELAYPWAVSFITGVSTTVESFA